MDHAVLTSVYPAHLITNGLSCPMFNQIHKLNHFWSHSFPPINLNHSEVEHSTFTKWTNKKLVSPKHAVAQLSFPISNGRTMPDALIIKRDIFSDGTSTIQSSTLSPPNSCTKPKFHNNNMWNHMLERSCQRARAIKRANPAHVTKMLYDLLLWAFQFLTEL